MRISELIAQLEQLRVEHGDLPVVTPGFDESGLASVASFEVVKAVPIKETIHGAPFEALDTIDGKWRIAIGDPFDALVINF